MSNSSKQKSGARVLTIPVGDRGAFDDACAQARTESTVRAAVLHLSGGVLADGRPEEAEDVDRSVEHGMPALLAALHAPVVAALSGRIDDRVLELALAADVRVCDAGATFAMTQPARGELPSDGGTQRLPRVVGPALAADMLLTGRRITAPEAFAAGLVTEIAADGRAAARADEIAAEISTHGAAAGRFTKEAVLTGADMSLDQSLRLEADLAILLHTDPERAEGIDAFNARRKPDYRGEPGIRHEGSDP